MGYLLFFFAAFLIFYTKNNNVEDTNVCIYTLYVKTGSIIKGGANSKISVGFEDAKNESIWIPNLKSWGAMREGYSYFERGNVDAFSGRGPCIEPPICRLNLTSDGSGSHHGWYCDYVEVISTGPHKPQTIFYVDQWLAKDVAPYNLTVIVDGCGRVVPNRPTLVVGSNYSSIARY